MGLYNDNNDKYEDEDIENSSYAGSETDSGAHSRSSVYSDAAAHVASQETKLVVGSKVMVYFAIMIAAAAVSTVSFIFLTKEEENNMVVEFSAYSKEILKQAQANSRSMFDELWDLSRSITSHTLDTNQKWPNCTIPHFDIRAQEKQKNSRLEFAGFAPFVTPENRKGWERYSVDNQGWIAVDYKWKNWTNVKPTPIPPKIHRYNKSAPIIDYDDDMFDYEIPLWQVAPARKNTSIINLDLATIPVFAHLLWDIKMKKVEQFSRIFDVATLNYILGEGNFQNVQRPRGFIYQPVFQDFRENSDVVAFMIGTLTWDNMFKNVLFESSAPLIAEIQGNCSARFTYKITGGEEIEFLGYGEGLRDPRFDKYRMTADLLAPLNSRPGYPPVKHTHRHTDAAHGESHCMYVINTYPTEEFYLAYKTYQPIYMTIVISSTFFFTALAFLLYDYFVSVRQTKLEKNASRTFAIVSSLFPKDVRNRMMEEVKETEALVAQQNSKSMFPKSRARMSEFLNKDHLQNGDNDDDGTKGKPIADLFPSATIFFADICGFTAWSSAREPTQVFSLLEALYGSFDKIARRRKVFKVETIGDCYVACCGLPEERPDHATVMARFSRDCLTSMQEQLLSLEMSLGPDTCDLGMRIGLHSGPVTAGVLRGERARFQLFGDTVNTCSRIETTGQRNRIHISEDTANLLVNAGKQSWIEPRNDEVEAKGKGKLRTFWLRPSSEVSSHYGGRSDCDGLVSDSQHLSFQDKLTGNQRRLTTKDLRLVDWNVDLLCGLLRKIKVRSKKLKSTPAKNLKALESSMGSGQTEVLHEVKEIIEFKPRARQSSSLDDTEVELSPSVTSELTDLVRTIASMYKNRENSFHNWEHASHVVASTCKLLSRIVSPEDTSGVDLHHGIRIASDPLTQFAVVLSALIHDADHPGVPNSQLMKEGSKLSSLYQKSIAEQNSFNLFWSTLMEDRFSKLRAAIYSTEDELKRFRQLLVNAVLATDIMDKELGNARKDRWNKAFTADSITESSADATNRKATIVIEHLIQASDVAHTMQHWHIYAKWNERLFHEMYGAYVEGRGGIDPSVGWYKAELGFFDFYIIPLAKKLGTCGVFGVSSDEYLSYAQANRREWEAKGEQLVKDYLLRFNDAQRQQHDDVQQLLKDMMGLKNLMVPERNGTVTNGATEKQTVSRAVVA